MRVDPPIAAMGGFDNATEYAKLRATTLMPRTVNFPEPRLLRVSRQLSSETLITAYGRVLGVTQVSDAVDFIQYGGGFFARGEWSGHPSTGWFFHEREPAVVFYTHKLDPVDFSKVPE